jgi:hypothetical protein
MPLLSGVQADAQHRIEPSRSKGRHLLTMLPGQKNVIPERDRQKQHLPA